MALDVLICIAAVAAMCYATWWVVKWFFKLGSTQVKKSESLTPTDLRVLEDTTQRLMDDLRALTDECVARIECACANAERFTHASICVQENQIEPSADVAEVRSEQMQPVEETEQPQPTETSRGAQSVAAFAKSVGLTTGEVQLMRELRRYSEVKKTN